MRFLLVAACLAFVLLSPVGARAHLGLDAPVSRYGPDVLKTGPCGKAGGERTGNVTYYEPGETIEVDDGVDDFVDPATMMELYSNDTVLLDGIPDEGRDQRAYVATVRLPDITCDNCTLQVIQVMYDKPPYTTPGNDIYYQCADLVLREGGAPPDAGIGPDAATDPSADGCATATGRLPGPELISMLLILFACRLAGRRGLPV
ncbi:MAG: hypothetical protein JRE82_08975 [Deltaproteobacteria bacterium]|nr:hypothetical protein [Deltaproteobacteria bacterium]